ncbi:hypothetical protein CDL15_Pgr023124 [Punica granatum]|uniref:Uncharacterized protein n=1 Tax=Punica granatum TaxID=22663 RepID=A0A218X5S3_PUNGR|nr:hypothetical protein CDL15_Pgr023124 [Punica granatum]
MRPNTHRLCLRWGRTPNWWCSYRKWQGERPGEGGVGRDGDTEGGGGGIVTIGERELPEEEEEAWTTEAAEMGSGRGPHWERSGGVKKPT